MREIELECWLSRFWSRANTPGIRINALYKHVYKLLGSSIVALGSLLFAGCGGGGGGTGGPPPVQPPPPPTQVSYSIIVTNQPSAERVRVGESARASITWRFTSTATVPSASDYSVTSSNQGVTITNGSGSSMPNVDITTELEYVCTTFETVVAQISISVESATRELNWSLSCTGQRITAEPLEPLVLSIGNEAQGVLSWSYESVGENPEELAYTVSKSKDDLSIEPEAGEALPREMIRVALHYMCETPGDYSFELTMQVGTATETTVWDVTCSEETIVIEAAPKQAAFSVGEEIVEQLTWQFESTYDGPREIPFTVVSSLTGLTLTNGDGSLSSKTPTTSSLKFQCTGPILEEIELTISVGSAVETVLWTIECTRETIELLTAMPVTHLVVGESETLDLFWQFASTGEIEREIAYLVATDESQVDLVGAKGQTIPGTELSTRLIYSCDRPTNSPASFVFTAGSATYRVTWSIICTEEAISVDDSPQLVSLSVGETAVSELLWVVESSANRSVSFNYTIESTIDSLVIKDKEGRVSAGEKQRTNLEYACEESERVTFEITLAAGSAQNKIMWEVECTVESIEVAVEPISTFVSVGDSGSFELMWKFASTGTVPREFEYTVVLKAGQSELETIQGVIENGAELNATFVHHCLETSSTPLEIDIRVGNAERKLIWPFECTQETFHVDVAPESQSISVGDTASSTLQWHIETTASKILEFEYVIESSSDALKVSSLDGVLSTGSVISTNFTYVCDVAGRTTFELQFSVASATSTVSWLVECTQEDIEIFTELPATRLAQGSVKAIDVTWRFTSTAVGSRDFAYTIVASDPQVTITPAQGVALSSTELSAKLEYNCRQDTFSPVDVTFQVGNATKTQIWRISCAAEKVVIDAVPKFHSVSVGDIASASTQWHIESTATDISEFTYTITSATNELVINTSSGKVSADTVVTTNLSYECRKGMRETFEFSIDIGTVAVSQSWTVECTVESISISEFPLSKADVVVGKVASETLVWSIHTSGETSRNFDYVVSTTLGDLEISEATGNVSTGQTISNEIMFTCEKQGLFDFELLIEAGRHTATNSWQVECIVDTIAIVTRPESQTATIGESLSTELVWSFSSTQGDRRVPFSVSSSISGLEVTNGFGTVTEGQTVTTNLSYDCEQRERLEIDLQISVGDTNRDTGWDVVCLGGNEISNITVRFYQGPEVLRVQFVEQFGSWSNSEITSGAGIQQRVGLRTNRQVFADIQAESDVPDVLPITLSLSGGSVDHVPTLVQSNLSQSVGSIYVDQYVYEFTAAQFSDFGVLTIHIDANNAIAEPDETNNTIRYALGSNNTSKIPAFKIKLIPITTTSGTPDLSSHSRFTDDLYELMPVGTLDVSVLAAFDKSTETWSSDSADDILDDLWTYHLTITDLVSHYHGIVLVPNDVNLCGIAFIGYPVGITGDSCSSDVLAHEIGHNLTLRHAPACGAPNSDSNYPYPAGNIGSETGWLMTQRQFVDGRSPSQRLPFPYGFYDIMSYCPDTFISQFSYAKALSNVPTSSRIVAAAIKDNRAPPEFVAIDGRSVVVSGHVSEDGFEVNHVVKVEDSPFRLYSGSSDQILQLVHAGSGLVLYKENIELIDVAHSQNNYPRWGGRIPYFDVDDVQLQVLDPLGNLLLDVSLTGLLDKKNLGD